MVEDVAEVFFDMRREAAEDKLLHADLEQVCAEWIDLAAHRRGTRTDSILNRPSTTSTHGRFQPESFDIVSLMDTFEANV